MKILIISDIHGNKKYLSEIINNNTFDKLFILGDILSGPMIDGYDQGGVIDILDEYRDKIEIVKGNCDTSSDFNRLGFKEEDYLTVIVDNKRFLLTHGNMYNYYHTPDVEFDIFLQGHTHVPVIIKMDNKIYANPGSITLPKGEYENSYAIYENNKLAIYQIDGTKIMEEEIDG